MEKIRFGVAEQAREALEKITTIPDKFKSLVCPKNLTLSDSKPKPLKDWADDAKKMMKREFHHDLVKLLREEELRKWKELPPTGPCDFRLFPKFVSTLSRSEVESGYYGSFADSNRCQYVLTVQPLGRNQSRVLIFVMGTNVRFSKIKIIKSSAVYLTLKDKFTAVFE